ncbi:MAG TPA: hypothetical protein VMA09_08950 [Candidatus Binataceae bacterium]|nr:hypothetical protein [Candidatus Binataceae bacterium]
MRMKLGRFTLAIAAIAMFAVAGCGEPPISNRAVQLDDLQAETGRVKVKEQECTLSAMKRSDDSIAEIVSSPDLSIDMRMQAVVDQRNRDLAKCESDADNANDQLTEGERTDYQNETQEQRQRVAAIILSQP